MKLMKTNEINNRLIKNRIIRDISVNISYLYLCSYGVNKYMINNN